MMPGHERIGESPIRLWIPYGPMTEIAFLVCGAALLGPIGVPAALLLPPSGPAQRLIAYAGAQTAHPRCGL